VNEPRDVAEEINSLAVANPKASAGTVAMKLPFAHHLAQRRRVQQTR
jgi:hypothetical protein